ncbi:ankyrin repeat domain-containing protein [Hymenobacter weizhouensis]|uniref:ankyrin repeat domain-containing protein n=1 Tax=Hymenobacter sp. YIM 151500-1 TaxID=2987689 RepID=UPI002226D2DE|nr:ankyrin repeat domain-containing protein [Hymenobacter sp. YIM 151500-1]UYZ62514.1 ankyrin repeat domain-containing protein [Hymenobacter sp. YIM 151500-1]
METLQPELYFSGRELAAAQAIIAGDTAELERLLAYTGLDPDGHGAGGLTLLLFAFGIQRNECLQTLLRWRANPNRETLTDEGELVQPVALAAGLPNLVPLRLLLAAGGDPNSLDRGEPALFNAIHARNWSALRLLVEAGADLNRTAPDGTTPMLLLAYLNQYEQVDYLLGKGADFERPDSSGGTVAFAVQTADLEPESEEYKWLRQVKRLLELRGVSFPVPDPSVAWAQQRAAEEKLRQQWNRTPEGRYWEDAVNRAAVAQGPTDDGVALLHLQQAAEKAYEQWAASAKV